MPLFGAAYAAPNKGTIKVSINNAVLQKKVEFKDFSMLLSVFQNFSRQIEFSSTFKKAL